MKSTPRSPSCPHVAVCVDKARTYGRGVLQGIADYLDIYGPWSLSIDPEASGSYGRDWLKNWRGDGVLAYIEDPAMAAQLRRARIPAVELFRHRLDLGLPQAGNDEAAIGRLAAEHLLERQFSRFAFCGYRDHLWSDRRGQGFAGTVGRRNGVCQEHYSPHRPSTLAGWESSQELLADWLKRLPKPVGLMACSDRHALRVLDACRRARLAVPEEIAVIGVDNDEETCRLANPPLSSVIDDSRRIGFEAAQLLDRLMSGRAHKRDLKPILIPPAGVATRRSTDVTALQDRLMANAVRSMRDRACEGLTVSQLVNELHVSRSVFYRRFQDALGRSPHQEILRLRLERVKTLLRQTRLSLEQIAALTGFEHSEYLSVLFKRELGLTPGAFRHRQQDES